MIRSLIFAAALFSAPAALACGGQPCGGGCAHSASSMVGEDVDASTVGTKLTLEVEGMTCGECATTVYKTLKAVDGVTAVNVDHKQGAAQIRFDPAKTNAEALVAALNTTKFKTSVPAAK